MQQLLRCVEQHRHRHRLCHAGVPVCHVPDRGLRRRHVAELVRCWGLARENFDELSTVGKIADYFWHLVLPVTSLVIGGFATLTILTKNSFLNEITRQYVVTRLQLRA